jgi:hypothetical protein
MVGLDDEALRQGIEVQLVFVLDDGVRLVEVLCAGQLCDVVPHGNLVGEPDGFGHVLPELAPQDLLLNRARILQIGPVAEVFVKALRERRLFGVHGAPT